MVVAAGKNKMRHVKIEMSLAPRMLASTWYRLQFNTIEISSLTTTSKAMVVANDLLLIRKLKMS